MNIKDYQAKIGTIGFEEFPTTISGMETRVSKFIEFDEADLDLKIYLTTMVIRRCFSVTGTYAWPDETDWLIANFMRHYEGDLLRPWLNNTIKEAINMMTSDDTFVKEIIGTTFIFGIIEFYAKYELGYRPMEHDFFDDDYHKPFRNMFLGGAINRLKKLNKGIAHSLTIIDKHNVKRLKELEALHDRSLEGRWIRAKIADRLSLARNTMLHGENHSFYSHTKYLVLLYMLFHWHRLKEMESQHSLLLNPA